MHFITLVLCFISISSFASRECMIGEVSLFAGNFAPRNWASLDGQILPISQNQALFSILGTMYGGDGRTTFRLPDLRGRVALHTGAGPGLTQRRQGELGGKEQNGLVKRQIPARYKRLRNAAAASQGDPDSFRIYRPASNSQDAVDNMQPFQALRYIICLNGIFPARG